MSNESRYQIARAASDSATRIRHVLLANPAPTPRTPGRDAPEQDPGVYPLGMVLSVLTAEHTALIRAVAEYSHALAYHPATGKRDDLAPALARLTTGLSSVMVRFHGQERLREHDFDAIVLSNQLREVLVAATMLLADIGPLEIDVLHRARNLDEDADPRWRAALGAAAAYAEPAWVRAEFPAQPVHLLGLHMLAIGLYVKAVELNRAPGDVTATQMIELLSAVAHDPLWNSEHYFQRVHAPAGAAADLETRSRELDARDRRVAELRSRVESALVLAGINLESPDEQHRDLVLAWRDLQRPPPESSDLSINGTKPPYTWRPHLPEGVLRASSYLRPPMTDASATG